MYDCHIDFQQSGICFVHSETKYMCVICGVMDTSVPLSILGATGCESMNIASMKKDR